MVFFTPTFLAGFAAAAAFTGFIAAAFFSVAGFFTAFVLAAGTSAEGDGLAALGFFSTAAFVDFSFLLSSESLNEA
ncbi:hypothetical protein AQUCO_00700372v1 [Aquilegia coerulea]|uniref:Uncharacterized protein n=1 Tax=Aquilegia coerulea TaxID=218851 RepID=A0A2G5EJS9_AQUCA|nr:hypothetical protein AQUCO_00700372v1 [Aquilegia coerulea]